MTEVDGRLQFRSIVGMREAYTRVTGIECEYPDALRADQDVDLLPCGEDDHLIIAIEPNLGQVEKRNAYTDQTKEWLLGYQRDR